MANEPGSSSLDSALFQENERTAARPDGRQTVAVGPIAGLSDAVIAFETWGTLSAARDNAILVCHALSGDSHAVGWWDRIVGPSRPIDPDHFFVIGTNALGGCQGSIGPGTLDADGRRLGTRFPAVTVEEMVEAQRRVLAHLGVDRLFGVAGGSMGGMQALAWGATGLVERVWCTASCAAHNALQIGFNEAARQAVRRDPKWRGGDFPADDPPRQGLSVARMVGHLSYLSEAAFDQKFGRDRREDGVFQIESYLNYQGDKFTDRFDAGSLVVLSEAIDRYECRTLVGSRAEFLFTSFRSDWLYPTHQSLKMLDLARAAGRWAEHVEIDLPHGHDAFLLDGEVQGEIARQFFHRAR